MPKVSLVTNEREIIMCRWELARRDPLRFAEWFVFTLDQHDKEHPIKPFPARKPHIVALTRLWQANRMLFVEKSRQMLVTWWAAMLCVWECLFHDGRLIYQQSKRLEDVVGSEATGDGLLGRSKFIVNHIPYAEWLLPPGTVEMRTELLTFPKRYSSITPIAQGGDKIRSHTVSGIVTDETALQAEFEAAMVATMASVRRGWWLGITTPGLADGGYSMRVARDMADPR